MNGSKAGAAEAPKLPEFGPPPVGEKGDAEHCDGRLCLRPEYYTRWIEWSERAWAYQAQCKLLVEYKDREHAIAMGAAVAGCTAESHRIAAEAVADSGGVPGWMVAVIGIGSFVVGAITAGLVLTLAP